MGLLIHLLCLLLPAPAILCGTVTLTSPEQYAVLGTEVSFTCTVVNARVAGLILFSRDDNQSFRTVCRVDASTGGQISGTEEFLCSAVEGQTSTYSLAIRNVSRNDSTVWICQAGGMTSNRVTLDVQYPPTVEIHTVTPCSGFTFLVSESNVALNCSVKGANPAPTSFTWYHEDVTLQNGPSPIYTISRVTRSTGGHYRCTADNGIHPPGEYGVQVDVHFPPIMSGNNTKIVVNETEDVSISCQPEANPEVTSVVWTKKGARVSDTGTLYLSNIQHDDAGEYMCTATNEVTSCSGGTHRESSSLYVTLEVQYAPQVEYFGVTSGTRTTTVTEHDNVTLQCDVRSNPASSIEIRNKTHSIGSSKGVNSGRQTLTTMLLNVSCLEGGNYFCAAGNLHGGASQTLQLQVSCVPRRDLSSSDELVFTSNLHENVTLSLTVIAFPKPTFTWRKNANGRPISTTEATTDGVRVTGSVTIVDVKQEDYINYTVHVSNAEGTLDLEISLVPKSRPHLPSNLTAVNIRLRSVTLRWEKGFNGGATQSFTILYRQSGGEWTTHPARPTEDNTLQLDIDGLEPGTVYEFRINAQNEYGASDYTDTITVRTESASPTGVPVYVVVIASVTSALLTAALYKAVMVGWPKRKSSTRHVTATESEGNYEVTRRDMNVGENAYCSVAPVEAAVYVNTNNHPRPASSTSAASRKLQSPNTYYSIVADSAL
ncbi:protein turtle-like [Haliotis asinina]|uniref:protein turtle-like n=1 Tax=Haliotis asinina TaxID=109174 RepID=UPI003531D9CB